MDLLVLLLLLPALPWSASATDWSSAFHRLSCELPGAAAVGSARQYEVRFASAA